MFSTAWNITLRIKRQAAQSYVKPIDALKGGPFSLKGGWAKYKRQKQRQNI